MLPSMRPQAANESNSESSARVIFDHKRKFLSDCLLRAAATEGGGEDQGNRTEEPRWKRSRFLTTQAEASGGLGLPLSQSARNDSGAFRSLQEPNSQGWALSDLVQLRPSLDLTRGRQGVAALAHFHQGFHQSSSLPMASFPIQLQQHQEFRGAQFSLVDQLRNATEQSVLRASLLPANQINHFLPRASTEAIAAESLLQQHIQNGSLFPPGYLTSLESRLHLPRQSLPELFQHTAGVRLQSQAQHGMGFASLNRVSQWPVQFPPASTSSSSQVAGLGRLALHRVLETSMDAAASHDIELMPSKLPRQLATPEDNKKLSPHQVFLRYHIEAFKASEEDVSTHTRGRNRPVTLGQVGIRCRHCAHLPLTARQKGSVYFPATLLGLYQAAQNMSTQHLQCGLCASMPEVFKRQFAMLLSTKASSSGAGRMYWSESAKKIGLLDTSEGIRFVDDVKKETVENETESHDPDVQQEDMV